MANESCSVCGANIGANDENCPRCNSKIELAEASRPLGGVSSAGADSETPGYSRFEYDADSGDAEPIITQVKCVYCSTVNPIGSQYCGECGEELPVESGYPSPGNNISLIGPPAGILQRIVATIIDGILFFILLFPLSLISGRDFDITSPEISPDGLLLILLSIIIGTAYETYMLTRFGTTVGKFVVGIYVVDRNSKRLSNQQAVIRALVKSLPSQIPFVNGVVFIVQIFVVILREDRRGIHDLIADTYPIRHKPHQGWTLQD